MRIFAALVVLLLLLLVARVAADAPTQPKQEEKESDGATEQSSVVKESSQATTAPNVLEHGHPQEVAENEQGIVIELVEGGEWERPWLEATPVEDAPSTPSTEANEGMWQVATPAGQESAAPPLLQATEVETAVSSPLDAASPPASEEVSQGAVASPEEKSHQRASAHDSLPVQAPDPLVLTLEIPDHVDKDALVETLRDSLSDDLVQGLVTADTRQDMQNVQDKLLQHLNKALSSSGAIDATQIKLQRASEALLQQLRAHSLSEFEVRLQETVDETVPAKSVSVFPSPRVSAHYPCHPKQTVDLTRNVTGIHGNSILRHIGSSSMPPVTAEYRMMFIFSESWGFLTSGKQSMFIYQDEMSDKSSQTRFTSARYDLLDRWAHITLVVTEEHIELFIDGKSVEANAFRPSRLLNKLFIGPSPVHQDYNANALFSHVRYSNYAMTAQEIEALVRSLTPPSLPFPVFPAPEVRDFAGRDELVSHCQEKLANVTAETMSCLERLIAQSDREAMLQLGSLLWQGSHVDQDVAKAVFLLNASAYAGNTAAMVYMGLFCAHGIAMPVDREKSLVWYTLAVAAGDEEPAYVVLGSKFFHALDGVRRDAHVAAGYFEKMAEKAFMNIRDGGFRVIDLAPLSSGTDMQLDHTNWEEDEVIEAERYHAEAGDVIAQAYMGDLHYNGLRNAPMDVDRAAHYYRAAAAQGFVPAKVQLVRMHLANTAKMENSTALKYLNESSTNAGAVALLAHIKANGLLGEHANLDESLGLFDMATTMPEATGEIFTNTAVMMRSTGKNQSRALRLFLQGAARNDPPAFYWLGQLAREGSGGMNASAVNSWTYYRFLATQTIDSFETTRGFDCFLANRVGCAIAAYLMATEMGSPEAAADLAFVLKSVVDVSVFTAIATEPFLAPVEETPLVPESSESESGGAAVARVFFYPPVFPRMSAWNDTRRKVDHFNMRAFELRYPYSSLDSTLLALNAADSLLSVNLSAAFRLYKFAADFNNTEGIYNIAWFHETGSGGIETNYTLSMSLYLKLLLHENATWVDLVAGSVGVARVVARQPFGGESLFSPPDLSFMDHQAFLWLLVCLMFFLVALRELRLA